MRTKPLTGVLSVVLMSVGIAAIPGARTAHAASGCWDAGFRNSGYEAYYCNNVVGAPLYNSGFTAVVDHLRTNPSWFACKIDYGPSNGEGSPHPKRWLWTKGDDNHTYGYVSDAKIYSETNPVHTC